MHSLIALLLFAQSLAGTWVYTWSPPDSSDVILATPTGQYLLQLGYGCDTLQVGQNMLLLPGSGGVATLITVGGPGACNVFVGEPVSDQPCATDANGLCDANTASSQT